MLRGQLLAVFYLLDQSVERRTSGSLCHCNRTYDGNAVGSGLYDASDVGLVDASDGDERQVREAVGAA